MQLVVEDYLLDVCKGRWIPKNPNAKYWHGYNIPQTIMPQIPLTEYDAVNDYGIDPIYSLEYKRKHTSSAEWASHIMGEFFEAQRRPITREIIQACMNPYNYLKTLSPAEIYDIKYHKYLSCSMKPGPRLLQADHRHLPASSLALPSIRKEFFVANSTNIIIEMKCLFFDPHCFQLQTIKPW